MPKLLAFLILVIFAFFPAVGLAKCEHFPIPWTFGGPAQLATWRISGGSSCSSTMNHPENIASIEIEIRPKNGIAGRNGPYGVAYQPNSGFKGTDDFTFKVISNSNYRKGPGLIGRTHVRVISE